MSYNWSAKQRLVEANVFDPSVTQLLIPGPVQSGKTLSAVFFFLSWAAKNWSGYEFALCSRSMRQYSAVLSKYAREFGVLTGLGWTAVADHHEMRSAHGNLNNKFYLGLGSDISSEAKVRGWTLAGALLDEVTLMPEDFVNTVLDRCSIPGAKVVMCCNPAGPMHHVKLKFMDRPESAATLVPFRLADNPSLSQGYIDGLNARYTGAMKRRMVYGEWAATSGIVYPNWENALGKAPPLEEAWRFRLAGDFGAATVTHMLLIALYPNGQHWVVREWVYDGRTDGQLTEAEQADKVKRELVGRYSISEVVIDPAALGFRMALGKVLHLPIQLAENEVLPGIQKVTEEIDTNLIKIDTAGCPELARQGYNYRWDERAGLRGEDRPAKEDDHGLDALRYDVWTHIAGLRRGKVRVRRGSTR